MWQDIRAAVRGFRQSPGFAFTALATLTLAIAANSTVFSLLNALVGRDADVRDPRSLVQISSIAPPQNVESGLTYAMYDDFKRRQQAFSSVIGWRSNGIYNIDGIDGGAQHSRGLVAAVSGNFFDELGARAAAGRLLAESDIHEPSVEPSMVAVLGHAFWRRAFASDSAAIGRRVSVEGTAFTVIGVAPPHFLGLGMYIEPDVTVPLTAFPKIAGYAPGSLLTNPATWVRVTGRLKPGVSIDQARAGINLLWRDMKAANVPPSLQGARRDVFLAAGVSVRSAAKGIETGPGLRGRFTRPLYVLLAIALLVLVIACLNLASLMVARGVAAAEDIGVRMALGAAPLRVMRAVVVEGVLLAIGGGLAGLLSAIWISDALARLILQDFTVRATLDVAPDARVVAFTAVLTLAGGVLCSLVAAWRAGRQDVMLLLRRGTRTATSRRPAGRWLVAAQVGVSLMLLVHGGLLIRSLQKVRAVSSGMDVSDVVVAYTGARPGGYQNIDNDRYFPGLVARLEHIPGVQRAAISNFKPAGGGVGGELVADAEGAPDAEAVQATFMSVSPHLFDVLRMRIREGRDFGWGDRSGSRRVAIVSQTLAERLFKGGSALGKRVRIGLHPRRQDIEIVGVAGDAHIYYLKDPNLASIYVASLQEPELVDGKCLVIRGTGLSLRAIDEAVSPFGYEAVSKAESLEYIVDRVLLQDRLTAMFATFFGAVALLLAAIGVYGLMSFEVNQRRREMAIRVALGAGRRQLVAKVVGDGIAIAAAGLAVGVLLALSSVEVMRSLIFGVTPYDVTTIAAAVATLSAVATLACLFPALRVSKADPTSVLRAT
jgi:putative ABC transport system permease protein